jgi:ribonuclease HI
MKLANEMDITDLRAKSDSQQVTNQVSGEFQTKDPQLVKYLERQAPRNQEAIEPSFKKLLQTPT